jgi:hypothetical protein
MPPGLPSGTPGHYERRREEISLGAFLFGFGEARAWHGSRYFLPAVEVAKQEGVVMHLYHGRNPHRDLVTCCDERVQIDSEFIDSVRKRETGALL